MFKLLIENRWYFMFIDYREIFWILKYCEKNNFFGMGEILYVLINLNFVY